jgi:hypothetical protein
MQSETLTNRVIVRKAVPDDLSTIEGMLEEYNQEYVIDVARTVQSVNLMINLGLVLLGEYEDEVIGGMAGLVLDGTFEYRQIYFVHIFYVDYDYRHLTREFLKEAELCILPTSIKAMVLGVPMGARHDKLKRFYRMMGYSTLETHMCKNFQTGEK